MTDLSAEGIRCVVVEQVNAVIDTGLDPDDPTTLTKELFGDFGADSLDVAEIVMEVEDELDVEFTREAEDSIATVGDLVNEAGRLARAKGA